MLDAGPIDTENGSAIPAPFRGFWCGTDLGTYRGCSATYNGYEIESLPPLDEASFTGDFAWHGEAGGILEERAAEIRRLADELAEVGLRLPSDFVTYMTRADLYGCLDEVSCTANWTYLSPAMPSPFEPDARMVCFFRDQQDCVLWYLYLRPNGESFVVHSDRDLEVEAAIRSQGSAEEIKQLEKLEGDPEPGFFWCAPTVEVFAYRYWIENTLWFALDAKRPFEDLDDAQRAYLAHYAPAG